MRPSLGAKGQIRPRRRSPLAVERLSQLLEVLLQAVVCLLSRCQVARLQRLPKLVHQLADSGACATAAAMMMTVQMGAGCLTVLLNFGIILLGRRKIAGLQIRGKLCVVLAERICAL